MYKTYQYRWGGILDITGGEIYNLSVKEGEDMDKNRLLISSIAPDAAAMAEKYGLGIEIAEYCTAWNMDDFFAETDKKVRKTIENIENITFHGPFNELAPCAIDPKARALTKERFLQAIETTKKYGAKKIIFHTGYTPHFYFREWFTAQSVIFWQDFMKYVPEDFVICLENVREEEPEMMLEVIEGVNDSRFKMCFDIGHAHAFSAQPVEYWLEKCARVISHFHVHNNDKSYDTHSPLYEGTIDMAAFLERAEKLCPDATFALELLESEGSVKWLMG
ncbi:MAG: sugar phosphate isomerase/epimerase [Ruminococcaceae bacterium]|nr:sugar phosphate isomerase/epimerase [Oscillospiraceae bacterium]